MKPLHGTRVIDFTQAMAAPYCTMNLADMGADVIKLEPPGEGEPTRQPGAAPQRGHSATFMTMNRGKRGLAVDLKRPEGVEIVKRLAKTAHVFVQNYRRGVAERLGLGWDALSRVNPRLVYCAVSGFGGTRPPASPGGHAPHPARTPRGPQRAGHGGRHERDRRRGRRAREIRRAALGSLGGALLRLRHPLRAGASRPHPRGAARGHPPPWGRPGRGR